MASLQRETTVLPGHRIEITAPELPEGTRVEVVIVPIVEPSPSVRSALDVIQSLNGHRLFQTREEVRRHLEEERNARDR